MIILTRRTFLAGTTAFAAAGIPPVRAMAAKPKAYHALIVAVTKYPNLPPKCELKGPNYDADLVRDYLINGPFKFDPANITVLADGIESGGSPTHEGIKKAMDDLAAKIGPEDFVYLHMSGHGAQQPQSSEGGEPDKYDEIFLPADTKPWDEAGTHLPNALVDNDMGGYLDRIRSTGAFVWAVFDCCHSGTATRGVLDVIEEKERKVESYDLGIPDTAVAAVEKKLAEQGGNRALTEDGERKPAFLLSEQGQTGAVALKGGMVAFFAAQTVETTPEMPLPKDDPQGSYGLFTYTIFSKLAENPKTTYRQLGQAVLQQYSADGRTRPTPLFEGRLDAAVFDTEVVDPVVQWRIKVESNKATIDGGLLHGLDKGSILAVLEKPGADLAEAVAYLSVQSAKNLTAVLEPVEYGDKTKPKLSDIPSGAYARVAELKVGYALKVARPGPSEGLDAEVAFTNALLDELNADPEKRFNIELVEPGASAELRLAVLRENAIQGTSSDATNQPALWFLPASGDVTLKDGSRPPLVFIHTDKREDMLKKVGENLTTIFRATGLSRLAAATDYKDGEMEVQFLIKRQADGSMEELVASSVPLVHPGDEVHVKARNGSKGLVDFNVLYIGSDYSITPIIAERLEKNAELEEGLLAFTDKSFGMERMIAVFNEAPPQGEKEDLSFLAQDGVPATRGVEDRGPGGTGFGDMLRDLGMGQATRSAMKLGSGGGSKGAVMVFPVETVRPS
jgi:hypothetical protein